MKLTLLNINSGASGTPENRRLYETTAQEVFKMMRKNPQAEIVVALQSHEAVSGLDHYFRVAAGDISVWATPYCRADTVSKNVFDQLLSEGLIEKANQSSVAVSYKLSESAK